MVLAMTICPSVSQIVRDWLTMFNTMWVCNGTFASLVCMNAHFSVLHNDYTCERFKLPLAPIGLVTRTLRLRVSIIGYPPTQHGMLNVHAFVRYKYDPNLIKLFEESELILLNVADSVVAVSRLFYFSICTEK